MAYKFKDAINFAKKHRIQFRLYRQNNMYLQDLFYGVDVADAYDGYCRSESYNIYYDKFYGFRYERRHFSYAFKKDDMLVNRICLALNDDNFNCITSNEWIGCI